MTPTPHFIPRECPDCGLVQSVPVPRPGHIAACERCGAVLWRRSREPSERALAMAAAGLVCYLLLVSTPLIGVIVGGRLRESMVAALPRGFELESMPLLAALILGTLVVAPLARIALTILVLGGLRRLARPALLGQLARLQITIGPWSMPDVFLLGFFVAYSRLGAIAPVRLGAAAFGLGGLVLAKVATQALLDERAVWERISPSPPMPPSRPGRAPIACTSCELLTDAAEGSPCPRCGATLHQRSPHSIARAWAFLIAAAALYGPANFVPIMSVVRLGKMQNPTILGGAKELLDGGQWPLALLVFVASICIPVLKIVSMVTLLVSTQRGARGRLLARTRLYRFVDVIGRWSMIDVFMVSILTAVVQMGTIAKVTPLAGAPCFAAVVVLTMFSAASFDPRLMWDAAARQRAARPAGRNARLPA
jgi:paraquat-inducible protein A